LSTKFGATPLDIRPTLTPISSDAATAISTTLHVGARKRRLVVVRPSAGVRLEIATTGAPKCRASIASHIVSSSGSGGTR
jgi:hypothetical protein